MTAAPKLPPGSPRARIVSRDANRSTPAAQLATAPWTDLYHTLMILTWPRLIAGFLATYLLLNLLFALGFTLLPGSIANAEPGSFADAFSFSVQTFATIGYGAMAPASRAGHVLMVLEAFVGMLTTALVTGAVFAKFSRPTARVRFAKVAVVQPRNGQPHFMFRMANERGNQIVEARVQLAMALWERTSEGELMRRFFDLKPVRAQNMMFALSWTAMHAIEPDSPLYGQTQASLRDAEAELVVSLVGTDETMAQTVHARWSYLADEILFDHRYVDMIRFLPNGLRAVELERIDEVEPLATGPGAGPEQASGQQLGGTR
jgi:inward rectifier potassium channel